MNLNFINGAVLLIGLGLIGYSQFDRESTSTNSPTVERRNSEVWSVKPGSIYDGDTLRVVKGNQELKIRFCGTDSPELKQPLGVEARDYLRSREARHCVIARSLKQRNGTFNQSRNRSLSKNSGRTIHTS